MVFRFLKKRPVTFLREEEVEIILSPRDEPYPQIFITRIQSQSPQKIQIQIPPPVLKKSALVPGMEVTIHFRRDNFLGSFQAKVMDVMPEDRPPLFSVKVPSQVLWEEIVPSRLAPKATVHPAVQVPCTVKSGEALYEAVVISVTARSLELSSPGEFPQGEVVVIELGTTEKLLSFEGAVIKNGQDSEEGYFVSSVDLSRMEGEDHKLLLSFLSKS
ncbi:MAG: hypothetical protein RDV48_09080 [Candidatus Eremiobacteraeota bacterium]|nr:hypothetical protein [Candidatus Eremiobacteraeota bacterium]